MDFALMATSVTCIKPFLRPFHSGLFAGPSTGRSPAGHVKTSKSGTYYMLSGTRSVAATEPDDSPKTTPNVNTNVTEPCAIFRPDRVRSQTKIQTQERPTEVGTEELIISVTTEWDVAHEEAGRKTSQANPPT